MPFRDPDDPRDAITRIVDMVERVGLAGPTDLGAVRAIVERAVGTDPTLTEDALLSLVQAYGRAVDRVSAAEAQLAELALADVPDAERDAFIERWLADLLPVGRDTFALMHAHRLTTRLGRRIHDTKLDDGSGTELSVALVDLRRSTAFMLRSDAVEIAHLVDELYVAVAEVAARHIVSAGKFLGDGVLFLARDAEALVAAAREAVVALGERTPLHAGAGIARGTVIRRAGDWFGTPVNLAARLAEIAGDDELLIDEPALPAGLGIEGWRTTAPRGLDAARRVAVVASAPRPAADPVP